MNERSPWQPSVTVVIPTLNAERELAEVLDALARQRGIDRMQVLVVDSSSTDETAAIVRAHPHVQWRVIDRSDFNHGGTRRQAAEWADTEVIAYLTQDATPANPDWLARLVAPLADPMVAGVFGRQVPRSGCVPVIKYEIERVFADPPEGFYSDTNSAARRDTLTRVVPYRDIDFSEDFAFATDALAVGLQIRYAPDAAVRHSNDIRLRDYAARMRAEARGHALAGQPLPRYSWVGAMARGMRGGLVDQGRILRDDELSLPAKVKWLLVNPLYHLARWQGIYLGVR